MLCLAILLTIVSSIIFRVLYIINQDTHEPYLSAECKIRELNTEFVKAYLETLANQANSKETEMLCKYSDILNEVPIAEELKTEIEQKYSVTIFPYYDGYHIKPNDNCKSEYWS